LHKSECELSQEDLLVAHEETTLDPSVDCHTDVLAEVKHTLVFIIIGLGILNSLEEEGLE